MARVAKPGGVIVVSLSQRPEPYAENVPGDLSPFSQTESVRCDSRLLGRGGTSS